MIALLLAFQVITGTTFYFDHDAQSAADTQFYELCVDGVSDAQCDTVAVLRLGTTNTYQFTLPSTVSRGNRTLAVRAVGLLGTGVSGPSNTLNQRVVGRPDPPTTLRLTPEP
jgi:hypothetical protein